MGATGLDRESGALADLALQGVSKRFGDLTVLDDISLDVQKGTLCCLLGPSGCGKTTLLRIVAGFLMPEQGSVRLAGKDITRQSPQKRNVGLVFQNYALFPHLNVYDNVAYGLRRRGWSAERIRAQVSEALDLVELPGYGDRRIGQLSGGQQQRVALARVLVIEPRLLLLDEPLSNLDARLRATMRDEIRRIQRDLGITTLYVTHDQEEAMSIADQLAVMHEGRIEQIGPPRTVYERPQTSFVAQFVGRVNWLSGSVIGGQLSLLGRRYPIRLSHFEETDELLCAIRPERVNLRSVGQGDIPGTIEDVVYIGSMVRYTVALALPGAAISAASLEVLMPGPQAVYRLGDRVAVEIDSEDLHIFERGVGRS